MKSFLILVPFCFAFIIIYYFTLGIIPADIYFGIWGLETKSMIESSLNEPTLKLRLGNEIIPLMFQNRHGGAPLWFYKFLSFLFPIYFLHPLWISFWNALNIALFIKLLRLMQIAPLTLIAIFLMVVIDPLAIHGYAFFISEPIVITLCLFSAILLIKDQKKWHSPMAFFLLGLGFYIRISFLWPMLLITPLIWKRFRIKPLVFTLAFFLGLLPQILFMNYSHFFIELSRHQEQGNLTHAIYALIDSLFDKKNYLSFYAHQLVFPLSLSNYFFAAFSMLTIGFFGTKTIFNIFLLSLLSLSLVLLSVKTNINYNLYFFYFIWPFWTCLALALQNIKKLKFKLPLLSILLLTHLIVSLKTLTFYKERGFNPRHSSNLYLEITKYLQENNINKILLLNESSRGILESFSQEQIKGVFIQTPYETQNISNIHQVILFNYPEEGIVLVINKDSWSTWFKSFENQNIINDFKNASRYNIEIDIVKEIGESIIFKYKVNHGYK